MKSINKVKLVIFIIFRIMVAIGGISAFLNKEWAILIQAAVTLLVSFLPYIIETKLKMDLPAEFDIIIIIFLFTSMYLGEMNGFFYKIWWWDIFLHVVSGMIFGAVGYSLVCVLNKEKAGIEKMNPIFSSLFSFCFSMMIAALWEIFEYGMDNIFGANMQKSGLEDTMSDLIFAFFGALTLSILGYSYLKGKINVFNRFIAKFTEDKSNISD